MHILVIHPGPRFYRELLPLLSLHEASSAFARTLSAACDQIEAQSPDVIVLCSPSLQEREMGEAFLAFLGTDVRERVLSQAYTKSPLLDDAPLAGLDRISLLSSITRENGNAMSAGM